MYEWTDEQTSGQMDGRMDGWMDGWMDKLIDGLMDGWIYFVDEQTDKYICPSLHYFILQFGDQTFGQVVGGARSNYSFELFVETRTEEETFKKYNKGGVY